MMKRLLLVTALLPLVVSCVKDGCVSCTLRFGAHDALNMPDGAVAGDHSYMHHY